jgi:hypothetical protein
MFSRVGHELRAVPPVSGSVPARADAGHEGFDAGIALDDRGDCPLVRGHRLVPRPFAELVESGPAVVESCRSSGVATVAAIVSGLAPGSAAVTWMVGKSIPPCTEAQPGPGFPAVCRGPTPASVGPVVTATTLSPDDERPVRRG